MDILQFALEIFRFWLIEKVLYVSMAHKYNVVGRRELQGKKGSIGKKRSIDLDVFAS